MSEANDRLFSLVSSWKSAVCAELAKPNGSPVTPTITSQMSYFVYVLQSQKAINHGVTLS